jgi:hypothetical protein
VGFVVDEVVLGQVFSEYFGFPCQFSFHQVLHIHHHTSAGDGTIGQKMADVPSGISLTPPQETIYVFVLQAAILKQVSPPKCLAFLISLFELNA